VSQPYQPSQGSGPTPGVEYAAFIARFIAYLIDTSIVAVANVALAFALGTLVGMAGSAGREFLAGIGIILYFLVFLVLWLVYFPYFWARNGQTPGNMLLKIRVVRAEDGGRMDFVSGIVRLFGYFVSALVFYIGFIWAAFDTRHQGWHDKMAGTVVVKA